MIEVRPTAKAPLMGFSPQMRAFQAMASTWLNPGGPEHTGTTRRLAARVVADRNILWFAETIGQVEVA
jgi:hypothetical protein